MFASGVIIVSLFLVLSIVGDVGVDGVEVVEEGRGGLHVCSLNVHHGLS